MTNRCSPLANLCVHFVLFVTSRPSVIMICTQVGSNNDAHYDSRYFIIYLLPGQMGDLTGFRNLSGLHASAVGIAVPTPTDEVGLDTRVGCQGGEIEALRGAAGIGDPVHDDGATLAP
jgi:hypothetical protein